jgi:hypothetical protein
VREAQPARVQLLLEVRAQDAGFDDGGQRSLVDRAHAIQPAQVEQDPAAVGVGCALHARAAPERRDGDPQLVRQAKDRRDVFGRARARDHVLPRCLLAEPGRDMREP